MASSQGMQLQLQPIIMMLVLVQLVVVVIFSLSAATIAAPTDKNKFTAIGCDTSGSVQITDKNGSLVETGCRSQCSSINSVPNDGSCSGIGCYQLYISAKSFSKHANITDFNPCSYAFVVEDGPFNFSTTYLHDFKPEMVPIVLDWGHLEIIRVLAPMDTTVIAKQMEHVALLI
ncbi:hypothetical protein ACSBR1_001271 [Camellia fascicularis]